VTATHAQDWKMKQGLKARSHHAYVKTGLTAMGGKDALPRKWRSRCSWKTRDTGLLNVAHHAWAAGGAVAAIGHENTPTWSRPM